MTSEITYAEVRFKNKSNSSDPISEISAAPSKEKTSPLNTKPHKSNSPIIKLLLLFLLISVLLMISFFIAFILFFQKHSEIKEFSRTIEEEMHKVKNQNCSCCPKSWKSFGSNCYFISPEDKTKKDSEKICSAMQTHLLVITSQEEQDFITRNLDDKFDYYIGLSDIGTEGNRLWQWGDQTPYNESATFWIPGEPNLYHERCVVLHFHKEKGIWGWNDVVCTLPHKSICQMTKIHLSLEHST